ncbi:hypothetical protein Cgig2_010321 [Carnegiea gigantea]|uniref:Uncharacterized protein n=1 Tax=Carnegiea gigantea TaxID=171969 RepID=A0A9Q1GJL9_9CARY|nr:hypothetical protein Cgig2_010321 [Carnegiea gigantea]
MPKIRGGKGSRCLKWVADAQPSTGPPSPKRWSSHIATGPTEHPCHRRLKTTVTISDTTTSSSNRSAHTASSKAKATPNGVFLKSIVENVQITLDRLVLESIFGLQFINAAPFNLTRKLAKDLGWQHASNLTPTEAAALKVILPDTLCTPNVAMSLLGCKRPLLLSASSLIRFN